jgi:hypothetical protein
VRLELTTEESMALLHFRRTGQYVGKRVRWAYRHRKAGTRDDVLYRLQEMGLLDHFADDQWYLTDAGRYMVKYV